MTRTTPWRRTILHLRQIFLTDANTFICLSDDDPSSRLQRRAAEALIPVFRLPVPDNHFALNVIRALDKSYGVSSTVTLSPGRILM